MPLSSPVDRELIHTRNIRCEGYLRADGLWDIEGTLQDIKTYTLEHPLRQRVEAGGSTHDMKARVTVDNDRVIRAIEIAMDAYAFPSCTNIVANYQRLVGHEIGPGFTKNLHEISGRTAGCTHVGWLLQCIARVALQTLTKKVAAGDLSGLSGLFGKTGEQTRPALIGSCHAYIPDGPVVKILFPDHYTGDA